MKNRMSKKILLAAMLCAMGVAAACGGADNPQDAKTQQEEPAGAQTGDEAGDSANASGSEAGDNAGAAQDGAPAAGNAPAAWSDTTPDLEGDIRELQDGQITVAEVVSETVGDGEEVMVALAPDSADDSESHKITVTYDENTLFAIQTIYDGGARTEMSEATAADLAENQLIMVWGSPSGEGWAATQVCIVEVE